MTATNTMWHIINCLLLLFLIYAVVSQTTYIRNDIIDLDYDYGNIVSQYERLKMYNETLRQKARATGLYADNDLIMIYVNNRTSEQIVSTFWHELAHHNISLNKKKTKKHFNTQLFIDTDYEHFCNLGVQTKWVEQ